MDSQDLQSSDFSRRMRTANPAIQPAVNQSGAVQKRSIARNRSTSASQAERFRQFLLEQPHHTRQSSPPGGVLDQQWLTPLNSPRPQLYTEQSLASLSKWTAPTPPRSDSGLAFVSPDACRDVVNTTCISPSLDLDFARSTASADMSSLAFLLPSQYGSNTIEYNTDSTNRRAGAPSDLPLTHSPFSMDQNSGQPVRTSQTLATSQSVGYTNTISSSPALYQNRTIPASSAPGRRHSELPSTAAIHSYYPQPYQRVNSTYDSALGGNRYSVQSARVVPPLVGFAQSPLPSPLLGSNAGPGMIPYSKASVPGSANTYTTNMYAQPQSFTSAASSSHLYAPTHSITYPPPFVGSSVTEVAPNPLGSDTSIRSLHSRPKPQCWEHGCNGRQFSTFSNLLRHQREKSGSATKSYCPKCGAEFTRTTARNGHLAHDKCTKASHYPGGT